MMCIKDLDLLELLQVYILLTYNDEIHGQQVQFWYKLKIKSSVKLLIIDMGR